MNVSVRFAIVLASIFIGSFSRAQTPVPDWLQKHVGDSANHISSVVLDRARANYFEKLKGGQTKNPCYIAFDATRRHQVAPGEANNRGYFICEDQKTFTPFTIDHGGGRNLPGMDISNDMVCVKNFGNAMNSLVTMGGRYLTGQINHTFKGLLKDEHGAYQPFARPFQVLYGEGDTSDAFDREIGFHPAQFLSPACYKHEPKSPYADTDGDVYYAEATTTYYDGRTDGCMGVRVEVAQSVMSVTDGNALAIYIYPESTDIRKVADAIARGESPESAGIYWNKECLGMIGTPKFWDRETYDKPIADEVAKIPPAPKVMCPNLQYLTEEAH